MKLVFLIILSVSTCWLEALEKADLVGRWNLVSSGVFGEDMTIQQRGVYEFSKDGKQSDGGIGIIYFDEGKQRAITLGSESEGIWSLKGNDLSIHTKKIDIHFFSSGVEDVDRSAWEEAMPEILEEPTIYSLLSKSDDKLIFKDTDDGSKVTLTRITEVEEIDDAEKLAEEELARQIAVARDAKRVRLISKEILDFDEFKFSSNLPGITEREGVVGKLRPTEEILDRLLCQFIAMAWVVTTEEQLASEKVEAMIQLAGLKPLFLESENEILKTPRKEAASKFVGKIGWSMENMWALAWVLGFEQDLDVDSTQVGAETMQPIWKFLSTVWADKLEYLLKLRVRSEVEVIQIEDLFYCCHNAVRSAQTGKKGAIPKHFHPIKHGGIIHEKRHALTWVLSPKVQWEDTDLST